MTQTNLLEQNKRIVRRAIEEGWNPANLAVIDELYAADFLFHQESGEAARGLEAVSYTHLPTNRKPRWSRI